MLTHTHQTTPLTGSPKKARVSPRAQYQAAKSLHDVITRLRLNRVHSIDALSLAKMTTSSNGKKFASHRSDSMALALKEMERIGALIKAPKGVYVIWPNDRFWGLDPSLFYDSDNSWSDSSDDSDANPNDSNDCNVKIEDEWDV